MQGCGPGSGSVSLFWKRYCLNIQIEDPFTFSKDIGLWIFLTRIWDPGFLLRDWIRVNCSRIHNPWFYGRWKEPFNPLTDFLHQRSQNANCTVRVGTNIRNTGVNSVFGISVFGSISSEYVNIFLVERKTENSTQYMSNIFDIYIDNQQYWIAID